MSGCLLLPVPLCMERLRRAARNFCFFSRSIPYRGFPIKFQGWGPIKNYFNNRGNLNFRCRGERQVSYVPIDQKFIGVVSTETEI
jgi:hypothetical protein